MTMRLNRWRERFGRCQECGRWRCDLEEGEVLTDYPYAHATAYVRQCQSCWDGDSTGITIRWFFEPRDIWVGVFWDRRWDQSLQVYICLIPMLPILLHFPPKRGDA